MLVDQSRVTAMVPRRGRLAGAMEDEMAPMTTDASALVEELRRHPRVNAPSPAQADYRVIGWHMPIDDTVGMVRKLDDLLALAETGAAAQERASTDIAPGRARQLELVADEIDSRSMRYVVMQAAGALRALAQNAAALEAENARLREALREDAAT